MPNSPTTTKCLLSSATGPCAELMRYAEPTLRAYAARHGYDVCINWAEPRDPLGERRAKIDLLRHTLPDYDLVVWIDADAMIIAFDDDLADEIPPWAFQAFVLEHSHWGFGPNTGVWAMRNEPESYRFLDELDRIGPHPAKPNSDQVIVHLALGWELNPTATTARPGHPSPFLLRTGWLDIKWNPVGYGHREPEPNVRHFYARPYERRREQMRDELARLHRQGLLPPSASAAGSST